MTLKENSIYYNSNGPMSLYPSCHHHFAQPLVNVMVMTAQKGRNAFSLQISANIYPLNLPYLVLCGYGFGMCILLLTIAHPCATKTPTIGCICNPMPRFQLPPTTPWLPPSTFPFQTHHAIQKTIPKEVGMGVPSKYLLLPVLSFGKEDTVTLKRARRLKPQRTKNERRKVSTTVRRPRAKAHTAGATPKDI